ncbi:MAG: hypothetical protein ACE5I5_15015 [Candidatus Heimdallarchaeota archaeon]
MRAHGFGLRIGLQAICRRLLLYYLSTVVASGICNPIEQTESSVRAVFGPRFVIYLDPNQIQSLTK